MGLHFFPSITQRYTKMKTGTSRSTSNLELRANKIFVRIMQNWKEIYLFIHE